MRILASLLAAMLAGCVETGDFGRVKSSVWNDAVAATGTIAARVRGEPASLSLLTDDEEELRGRAWRYLVPSRTRPVFDRVLAELVATRIVPPDLVPPDRSAYYRGLLGTAGRSPVSSYRKLSEDASADLRLVPGFALVAARVLEADRLRLVALGSIRTVDRHTAVEARIRVAENRCLVAWVTAASAFRVAAYRYALDNLFVEAPGLDAVPTEQAIVHLASERRALDALGVPPLAAAACAGDPAPRWAPRGGEVLSRKG